MLATYRLTILAACLLVGVCLFASPALRAQDEVAAHLAEVRAQINQREREVAQYRASMDLLRANGANGVDNPALQALAEELGRTRAELNSLATQEQTLSTQLHRQGGSPSTASAEVDRLTGLLNRYYTETETEQPPGADGSTAAASLLEQTEFDGAKVLLSGTEGVAAINLISERLARRSASNYSRQRSVVFNVEVRSDGKLVSKSNHSLSPIGESQYVGKVVMHSGSVSISVRNEQWRVQLNSQGEYLLTLYTPTTGEPQLHVIPVAELRATRWTETPAWLPPLENTASRS